MLENIKEGDIVHFRCGGSAVVESAKGEKIAILDFIGSAGSQEYLVSGNYFDFGISHVFDIIRVEKKKLTLADLKVGDEATFMMGTKAKVSNIGKCVSNIMFYVSFNDTEGSVRYYIGGHSSEEPFNITHINGEPL